ncbi:hypothetical protein [Streptomyces camelliae]|uniref:Uncharacterized protein n=1 Tax=Streptomyces camelliae TaxID=3004093 RepID=A0ABY7PH79_9ACTN|nr:hypothetical protein [Streptomyces sp. HUAS 2-6]WBO68972.1 hypothetical protein O1G22_42470 [Streptomyces sp. HUAS 2-6]
MTDPNAGNEEIPPPTRHPSALHPMRRPHSFAGTVSATAAPYIPPPYKGTDGFSGVCGDGRLRGLGYFAPADPLRVVVAAGQARELRPLLFGGTFRHDQFIGDLCHDRILDGGDHDRPALKATGRSGRAVLGLEAAAHARAAGSSRLR